MTCQLPGRRARLDGRTRDNASDPFFGGPLDRFPVVSATLDSPIRSSIIPNRLISNLRSKQNVRGTGGLVPFRVAMSRPTGRGAPSRLCPGPKNSSEGFYESTNDASYVIGSPREGSSYGRHSAMTNMLTNILRFAQILTLGTWVGSILYFSSVVTIGAFRILPPDQAGLVVGFTLRGLHLLGLMAAVVYLMAALALGRSMKAMTAPAVLAVMLMFVLTLASERIVIPRMVELRAQMGSVSATAATDSARAEFDRLHAVSVRLESGVLIVGLVALFLTVRNKPV
jgi:Domain of unknown function (DUF4149)